MWFHVTKGTSKPPIIHFLRKAWNSFARLLDISSDESFICSLCGPKLDVVVCEGTFLGFRKDLLPTSSQSSGSSTDLPLIEGSTHTDRILLRSSQARNLLLEYSGFTKDRKVISRPKQLTLAEFNQLCHSLKDGFHFLATLLRRLKQQTCKYLAPEEYRSFLAEVARSSPACGLIQN